MKAPVDIRLQLAMARLLRALRRATRVKHAIVILFALFAVACAPSIDSGALGTGGGGSAPAPVSCSATNPLLVVEADGSCGYHRPPGCDDPFVVKAGDPPTACTDTESVSRGVYTYGMRADGSSCELGSGAAGTCEGGYCCAKEAR